MNSMDSELLYELLGDNRVPSLTDVELLIEDYNLDTSPLITIPDHGLATETWIPSGPPNRSCYPGPFDFSIEIKSSDINKTKYLYSNKLNRIYVDMDTNFSVHFNWNGDIAPHPMYVRATVVFSDDAQAQKRVERCRQHYYPSGNDTEEQKKILKNVLHSSREVGAAGVAYCGRADCDDYWLSVLVEMNKTAPQSVAHAYKFVCKNSCSSGINRRAISIIFTLEDGDNKIYGRQMVNARVCACPRRDMYKDEESEGVRGGAKRPKPPAHDRPSKQIKVEVVSNEVDVITLPPLPIVHDLTVITGLEVMLNMMQLALDNNSNPAATDAYTTSIAQLRKYIEALKNKTAS